VTVKNTDPRIWRHSRYPKLWNSNSKLCDRKSCDF